MEEAVTIQLNAVHCEILRTKRRTLTLYIKHQKVLVRCPLSATNKEIDEFIRSNYDWINERLEEERIFEKEMLKIQNNSKIFYRARELTIVFRERREKRILVSGNKFIIQDNKINPSAATIQVEDYLIDKASEYIIPRAKSLARHLGVDGKIKEVKLRKTKSKWGHCTSKGIIQFNWLIMLAPYSIIDYIITHEVCHLIYMDHSRHFWNLVESICPGHKDYVTWLNNHEHRFWFE
ncbi:MAG: hypothetical protein CMQ30_03235 [Gammaproteobacteria bacterium]|nr:hypothetical protein [Gammaproteobacteria bacterium]